MNDLRSYEDTNNPEFPHAPTGWSVAVAREAASGEGLQPGEDHWKAVRALQEYFSKHADSPVFNARELHDALDEKFHSLGGMKYLYRLFPGGPISQGCRLAGLEPPAGSMDRGFGSVQ